MKRGIGGLMKQAQQMQEQMAKAQSELGNMRVQGESGGGMVKIEMNGRHEVNKVSLDPAMMDDVEMLEDLVTAAFNDAVNKVAKNSEEQMAGMTAGLNLPPGMKLPF
ncbi:MAG: YbaB/EbfC family nucleoid-associated protein [Xanthomonadales bacterium]|nr:YbaB/EbfC family nucleoid-associated protein [Xanthomonadales bacterium]